MKIFLKIMNNMLKTKATVSKSETPKEGTIEYLFKDYSGESFKTEITNPIEPVGNEKW